MIALKSCLNKVSDWQFLGEISASRESIASKIRQAVSVGEISEAEQSVLMAAAPQIVGMVAGLAMADIYRKAKKLVADDSEGDPTDFDPTVQDAGPLGRKCDECGMTLTGHSGHATNGGFYCDTCYGGLGYGMGGLLARKKTAEVEPGEVDILLYALNELTDPLAKTGDQELIMIQKLLSDFLTNLKVELQTSSTDQLSYEHADDEKINPGQGTEPVSKAQTDHSSNLG